MSNTQGDLFAAVNFDDARAPILDSSEGHVEYYSHFLPENYAERLLTYLRERVKWEAHSIRVYGRVVPFPRLVAWFNTDGKDYAFSGISLAAQPMLPPILRLLESFRVSLSLNFNSVLLNYYRSGNDSISWHSDDEPELGVNPTVASISLGCTRRFQLRHTQTGEVLSFDLEDGSLLLMRGATMHRWRHQIPKQPKIKGSRINLTFRYMYE